MQDLYNCKSIDKTHYRITKFDKHLHPKWDNQGHQSSYTVSDQGCDCPQGSAKSCRHRKMLPFFLQHDYVDSGYFFVWDTHQWYKPTGIFAEARKERRLDPTKQELDVELLAAMTEHVGIPTVVISEGVQSTVSAAPSPQPSQKLYRRF